MSDRMVGPTTHSDVVIRKVANLPRNGICTLVTVAGGYGDGGDNGCAGALGLLDWQWGLLFIVSFLSTAIESSRTCGRT